jgi:hypothetical protein
LQSHGNQHQRILRLDADEQHRHPGATKASAIADIGLRLQEGFYDLKLDQQLAPTKEALSNAIASGSTSFFKAVEGVRGRWNRRPSATSIQSASAAESSTPSTPLEVSKSDIEGTPSPPASIIHIAASVKDKAVPVAGQAGSRVSSWGSGLGSFISGQSTRFSRRNASQASLGSLNATTESEGKSPGASVSTLPGQPIKEEGEPSTHGVAM